MWCTNVCLASTTKNEFIGNSRVHRPIIFFKLKFSDSNNDPVIVIVIDILVIVID